MAWQADAGKLWIQSNRIGALMRIDPNTWEVGYIMAESRLPLFAERLHGIEYDNGFIWQVTEHQKPGTTGYEGYTPSLIKYDIKTGQLVEVVEFVPGSYDIHDMAIYNDVFYALMRASIRDGQSTIPSIRVRAGHLTAHRPVIFSASI
jgi:hypothetical protein